MKSSLGLAVLAVLTLVPLRARADDSEKHVKLFEQFADTVDKDKGNCDQMAKDLNKFLDDHKKDIAEQKAQGAKMTPEQRHASMEKYQDRFKTASEKMRGGMMACHDNANVKAAMARFHKESGAGAPMMHHGPPPGSMHNDDVH